MSFRTHFHRHRHCLTMWALASIAIPGATAAIAQPPVGKFTFTITEEEMKLAHGDDKKWNDYFMSDLPFQRMIDRNMPYVELANAQTSTAPINGFHLTIGDPNFHFSDTHLHQFAVLGSSTPGFDLTSTTDNTGDELIVNIAHTGTQVGLKPGETVRFKIDLDVDAGKAGQIWPNPDFRTVLFDMNGVQVYNGGNTDFSVTDNAMATAIFTPSTGAEFTAGPVRLPDKIVSGDAGKFYNNHYRKYRDKDPVQIFQVQATSVPEPASILLMVSGLMGGLAMARRSRRRMSAG